MKTTNWVAWGAFTAISAGALLLAALPGTSDVNVWHSWVRQLSTHGFMAGYNGGYGHIVHPPLGLLMLWVSHIVPSAAGVPVHIWPAVGFTGFGLSTWLGLFLASILVWRITAQVWLAVLFQLAFILNSVVYGYFDIWGMPFLLLALHAASRDRVGAMLAWALLASLVKWQFLIFMPFFALYALRLALLEWAAGKPARQCLRVLVPTLLIALTVAILFGSGIQLAFERALSHKVLSGQALNLSWLVTWAMHVRWPESYGPLDGGLIGVIRTNDTRVLLFLGSLFWTAYAFTLWRLWRAPSTPENLCRLLAAGYLAYFLLNRGGHENHIAPLVIVLGYLAWREPQWRWQAITVALVLNLNMFAFYDVFGQHRLEIRRLWGLDYTLPLAAVVCVALGAVLVTLWRGHPAASPRD